MTVRRLPATVLARGLGFTEGPIVTDAGDVIVTSIDTGTLHRITADRTVDRSVDRTARRTVELVATPGGGPNGACPGHGGTVHVAQNGGNWMLGPGGTVGRSGVQSVGPDGGVEWLSDDPLAPNDLCVGPDAAVYVTDPTRRRTYDDGRIWRVDLDSGRGDLLYQLDWFPNGIAIGPDPDWLYVASTGAGTVVRLPREPSGSAEPRDPFVTLERGHPDGLAFDADGNLVIGAVSHDDGPGEIVVVDSRGVVVERATLGANKRYTNVALSGDGVLVVTDSDAGAVLAVDWPSAGLALYPRRHESHLAPRFAPALRAGG